MPVGTSARSPGASVTSDAATMSAPASPSCAYTGRGRPASRRCTAICSGRPSVTLPNATLVPVSPSSEMPPVSDGRTSQYRESLRTPWWWYLAAAAIASLLAGEFHVGGLALTLWIPFAILVPLSIVLVWWLGHSRLEIHDGEL